MYYVEWTAEEIDGLAAEGVTTLWTEIDAQGRVTRELGFSDQGNIVYRTPSKCRGFGYFDNQVIDITQLTSSIDETVFLKQWCKAEETEESGSACELRDSTQ